MWEGGGASSWSFICNYFKNGEKEEELLLDPHEDDEDEDDEDEDDDDDVTAPPVEGSYDPEDFKDLDVSPDIR